MKIMRKFLVLAGGYPPSSLSADSTHDQNIIVKLGGAVIFSSGFTACNWFIAGYVFSFGLPIDQRIVVATIAAGLGLVIVLLFDRAYLYFSDTNNGTSTIKTILYGVVRVATVLCISFFTSQAIMPMLLGKELRYQALEMRDEANKKRILELHNFHRITEKEDRKKRAESEVIKLQKDMITLPNAIRHELESVDACFVSYTRELNALKRQGYSDYDAVSSLSHQKMNCDQKRKATFAAKKTYEDRIHLQLKNARLERDHAYKDLSEAAATVREEKKRSEEITSEALNETNSTVLWSLLSSNPAVMVKWAILSFMILMLELFPFIIKWHAGKTNIGRRIAVLRRKAELELETDLSQAEADNKVARNVIRIAQEAHVNALHTPSVQKVFDDSFSTLSASAAPTEAVLVKLKDITEKDAIIRAAMKEHLGLARFMQEAWSNAIKDSAAFFSQSRAGEELDIELTEMLKKTMPKRFEERKNGGN